MGYSKLCCQACGYTFDNHTNLKDESTVQEGDYSVCINCGLICQFEKNKFDLTLVSLNQRQLIKLAINDAENFGKMLFLCSEIFKKGHY